MAAPSSCSPPIIGKDNDVRAIANEILSGLGKREAAQERRVGILQEDVPARQVLRDTPAPGLQPQSSRPKTHVGNRQIGCHRLN
jgi:hypothetical protein